jgi:GAF domain-containing protein
VATGEAVLVKRPGNDYLRIRSGLGAGAPAAILLLPVKRDGAVVAIIELAVSQPFTPEHRQLLDELAPIVSASLERFQRAAQSGEQAIAGTALFDGCAGVRA